MKQFVTLFVVALLSGCVVPGVDQTPQMSQDSQIVEQAYVLCKRAVDSTPAAVRLSEAFVLGKNKSDRYLEKTANVSYATDAQISDLKSYQVDLKICRDKAIDVPPASAACFPRTDVSIGISFGKHFLSSSLTILNSSLRAPIEPPMITHAGSTTAAMVPMVRAM